MGFGQTSSLSSAYLGDLRLNFHSYSSLASQLQTTPASACVTDDEMSIYESGLLTASLWLQCSTLLVDAES
jgi:hypothetical protein